LATAPEVPPDRRSALPLRTLNPPHLRRVARAAALIRLKEIQDVSAELLKIKMAAENVKAGNAPFPDEAKRRGRSK
jgi:hypothetical protein